jgi:hypothetical protein
MEFVDLQKKKEKVRMLKSKRLSHRAKDNPNKQFKKVEPEGKG